MTHEDVLPITKLEADALHALGWESGYGWEKDFDWYHSPSAGYGEWITSRPALMEAWLRDLEGIRRDEKERRLKERLGEMSKDVIGLFQELCDWFEDRADADYEGEERGFVGNEEMGWQQRIEEILKQAGAA